MNIKSHSTIQTIKLVEQQASNQNNLQTAFDYLLAKLPNNKLIKNFFNLTMFPQEFKYANNIVKQIIRYEQLNQTYADVQEQNKPKTNQNIIKQSVNIKSNENPLLLTINQTHHNNNIESDKYHELKEHNMTMIQQLDQNRQQQQYIIRQFNKLLNDINIQHEYDQQELSHEWIDYLTNIIKEQFNQLIQDNKQSNQLNKSLSMRQNMLQQSMASDVNLSVVHQANLQDDFVRLNDDLKSMMQSNTQYNQIIKNQTQINAQLQQQLKQQNQQIKQLQDTIQTIKKEASDANKRHQIEQSLFIKSMTEHNEQSLLLNEQNKNNNIEIQQLRKELEKLMIQEQNKSSIKERCVNQQLELIKLQNKIEELQNVNDALTYQIQQLQNVLQQNSVEKQSLKEEFNEFKKQMTQNIIENDKQNVAALHPGVVKDVSFYNKQIRLIQSKLNDKIIYWENEQEQINGLKQSILDKITSANEIISYLQGQATNIRESQIPIQTQAQSITENLNKTFHLLLSATF